MSASFSRADLQSAYQVLTDSPEPDRSVGALAVQVEGQLAVVGSSTGSLHAPEANREPFHEVGQVTHKLGNPVHADR